MSKADRLFEELGYIKVEDDKSFIEYRKIVNGDLFEIDF